MCWWCGMPFSRDLVNTPSGLQMKKMSEKVMSND